MASLLPDQELLAAAARGDRAAFSQLYQRYRNRVYGFAYRMLGAQEVAEFERGNSAARVKLQENSTNELSGNQ